MKPNEIKELRAEKKLSMEALGTLCGVTKATVSRWEKGDRNPSGAALLRLKELSRGDIVPVTFTDLELKLLDENVRKGGFRNREDYLTSSLKHMIQYGSFKSEDSQQSSTMSDDEEPAYYTLPHPMAIAAGSGQDGDHLGEIVVSREYPPNHFAFRVVGDSMDDGSEQGIPDGSIAIIEAMPEGQPYAKNGEIYAWHTPDGMTLKRFMRGSGGKHALVSLNPDFGPIPYTEEMKPQGKFICVDR